MAEKFKPGARFHRKHKRVFVKHLRVEYRKSGLLHLLSTGPGSLGSIVDVSEVGLRIMALEPLDVGTRLTLKMEAPRTLARITLKGKVIRCRHLPENFELAVQLSTVGDEFLKMVGRLREDPMMRQGH